MGSIRRGAGAERGGQALRQPVPQPDGRRAKINLYLHVVGRRPDGYHLLDSLVCFTELGDELHLSPAETLSLEIDGPFAPALGSTDNLTVKAARLLDAQRGAALHLVKNLPVAAGIGGGSADAAAALVGLSRLWNLPAPTPAASRRAWERIFPSAWPMARASWAGSAKSWCRHRPCRGPISCWSIRAGRCRRSMSSAAIAAPSLPRVASMPRRPMRAALRDASGGTRQRSDRGRPRAAAGDRRDPDGAGRLVRLSARPHVGQRRHLLRPVRIAPGGGGGGRHLAGGRTALVGARDGDCVRGCGGGDRLRARSTTRGRHLSASFRRKRESRAHVR